MMYRGRRVNYQTFEKTKRYETIVLFVEIENAQHSGFLIKKGEKILPKGEIAKAVRDAKIKGVEMAVAPLANTNALIMLRITQDLEKILDNMDHFGVTFFVTYHRIFKEAFNEFTQSKGISPELFYRNPDENYAFPITYSEARFFKPTRFYDEIDVETTIKRIEPTKIVFEFKASKDGDIIAKGIIDRKWKRREISDVIKRLLIFNYF